MRFTGSEVVVLLMLDNKAFHCVWRNIVTNTSSYDPRCNLGLAKMVFLYFVVVVCCCCCCCCDMNYSRASLFNYLYAIDTDG